jgi:phosphatidylserine/phosphatidylglycerophosphate/cardiolipin synthase-like enzyme
LQSQKSITPKLANELSEYIVEALRSESANILPDVCAGLGMKEGEADEAFKSKRNYINARIRHYSSNEIISLAIRIEGKYPESKLDQFLSENDLSQGMILISRFDNIKKAIIEEIAKSKYLIWVAVAWFTDRELANELYKKSQEGINVQIILHDDNINKFLLSKLKEKFEVHLISNTQPYPTLMHNKFCVIDMQVVIHGSYNWTKRAEYNDDTISIIESSTSGKEFADQFIKIKKRAIHDSA